MHSIFNSILWYYYETECMIKTRIIRSEGVVWLCEVVAVSTGDVHWTILICHVGDEDSVPDVRVHPCHIQGEGRAPGEEDGVASTPHSQITHWT